MHPSRPASAAAGQDRTAERREGPGKDGRQPLRNPELLGWGLFLTLVGAAAMVWVEVPPSAVAVTSSLLLFAFGVAWCLSPAQSPAAASTPVPAASSPAPVASSAKPVKAATPNPAPAPRPAAAAVPALPGPAIPGPAARAPRPAPAQVRTDRPAPHGRRAAALPVVHEMPAEPSRWTRTFGPPETGQIPLQPYLARTPVAIGTADADLPDRRQRSHSSL